jgi:hypothetical protein
VAWWIWFWGVWASSQVKQSANQNDQNVECWWMLMNAVLYFVRASFLILLLRMLPATRYLAAGCEQSYAQLKQIPDESQRLTSRSVKQIQSTIVYS